MSSINKNTRTGPSFSFFNRCTRMLWSICYILFIRLSPRPLHAWRAFIYKIFGAQLGKNCHIYPTAKVWAPWNLKCKDKVCIGDQASIYNLSLVEIGEQSVISQNCSICTGTHDYTEPGFPTRSESITIGEHCWIAAEAFIMPGVRIGNGTVVGARSVVTENLPSWKVCLGHPCKPIKDRILHEQKSTT